MTKTQIIKNCIYVSIVLLVSFGANSQDQYQSYARVRLDNIETLELQQQITDHLRSKPGISVCRTDRRTDILFVLYDESVSPNVFEDWLHELGVQVICLVYGSTSDGYIKELPCQQVEVQIETPQK